MSIRNRMDQIHTFKNVGKQDRQISRCTMPMNVDLNSTFGNQFDNDGAKANRL